MLTAQKLKGLPIGMIFACEYLGRFWIGVIKLQIRILSRLLECQFSPSRKLRTVYYRQGRYKYHSSTQENWWHEHSSQ